MFIFGVGVGLTLAYVLRPKDGIVVLDQGLAVDTSFIEDLQLILGEAIRRHYG